MKAWGYNDKHCDDNKDVDNSSNVNSINRIEIRGQIISCTVRKSIKINVLQKEKLYKKMLMLKVLPFPKVK